MLPKDLQSDIEYFKKNGDFETAELLETSKEVFEDHRYFNLSPLDIQYKENIDENNERYYTMNQLSDKIRYYPDRVNTEFSTRDEFFNKELLKKNKSEIEGTLHSIKSRKDNLDDKIFKEWHEKFVNKKNDVDLYRYTNKLELESKLEFFKEQIIELEKELKNYD